MDRFPKPPSLSLPAERERWPEGFVTDEELLAKAATVEQLNAVKGIGWNGETIKGINDQLITHLAEKASITTLGHIKQGNGVIIDTNGVLSANVLSVAGKTGAVALTKSDVGLENVDNMSASQIRQATTIPFGLEVLTADPTTGLYAGRMYYNSSTKKVRVYNGTAWV